MSKGNLLFPAFLRLDRLHVLVVGAGEVGWEKLGMMFRHADNGKIRVVAPEIRDEIKSLAECYHEQIELIQEPFNESHLEGIDVVIIATADHELNVGVWEKSKAKGILTNVADTPELCDFYLSSVVKKGDLKVAISSNGKSPTLTKRIRELLEDVLPEEIDELLDKLEDIRSQLKDDFEYKVKKLDEITSVFKDKQ